MRTSPYVAGNAAAFVAAFAAKKCSNTLLVMHFCMDGSRPTELGRLFAALHHIGWNRRFAEPQRTSTRRPEMQEPLPDGGTIRKLWIGETDAYRDHLLRLDRESRHRRFSGALADEVIARHASTANGLGVVVHGFFVDGVLRGAAELRQNGSPVSYTHLRAH